MMHFNEYLSNRLDNIDLEIESVTYPNNTPTPSDRWFPRSYPLFDILYYLIAVDILSKILKICFHNVNLYLIAIFVFVLFYVYVDFGSRSLKYVRIERYYIRTFLYPIFARALKYPGFNFILYQVFFPYFCVSRELVILDLKLFNPIKMSLYVTLMATEWSLQVRNDKKIRASILLSIVEIARVLSFKTDSERLDLLWAITKYYEETNKEIMIEGRFALLEVLLDQKLYESVTEIVNDEFILFLETNLKRLYWFDHIEEKFSLARSINNQFK